MIRILGRGGGTAEPQGTHPDRGVLPDSPTASQEPLARYPLRHDPDFNSHRAQPTYPPQTSGQQQQQAYYAHAHAHAQQQQHYPAVYPAPYYPQQVLPGATSQEHSRSNFRGDPMGNSHVDYEEKKTPWFQRFAILTVVIILACIGVFLATMAVNNCPASPHPPGLSCVLPWLGRFAFEPLKINPMLGPTANTLLNMGALYSVNVLEWHQTWRLLTAMWLHAGVIHIVANMLGIYFLGAPMEKEFGLLKVGVIYLLAGISGALFSSLFLMNTVSVGASGALFGLAGATLTELVINWDLYANRVSAFVSLLVLILLNLAIGLMPYIDNFAHIGGLLAGLPLGLCLLVKPQRGYIDLRNRDNVAQAAAAVEAGTVVVSSRNTVCQNVARVVSAVVFLTLFFTALGLVLTGTHTNCSWCHYMTCVPTSLWDCNPGAGTGTGGAGPVCQQIQYQNGTGVLVCANNSMRSFPNMTTYTDYQLRVLCTESCS